MSGESADIPNFVEKNGVSHEVVNQVTTYKAIERLWGGGTSNVYKVNTDGTDYAIKASPFSLERERQALSTLTHPHILPVLDFRKATLDTSAIPDDRNHGIIVNTLMFRFIPHSLTSTVLDIPRETRKIILEQQLAVMEYIHARGIVHQDFKEDNILIDEDSTSILIDFGNARVFKLPEEEKEFLIAQKKDLKDYVRMMKRLLIDRDDGNRLGSAANVYSDTITLDQIRITLKTL